LDIEDPINQLFSIINDEKLLNNILDTRPGTEDQALKNLETERTLHTVVTLLFALKAQSQARQQQVRYQPYLHVLEGMLRRDSAEKTAKELGCNRATVYRYRQTIRFILLAFDALIIELKDRLSDSVESKVLQRITIGWDRDRIKRMFEEDEVAIDKAYFTIRTVFSEILKDFINKAKRDQNSIIPLLKASRHVEI
jgi:hypothetical protein